MFGDLDYKTVLILGLKYYLEYNVIIIAHFVGEYNHQPNIHHLEFEDQALLECPMNYQEDLDEGDIDDGEVWGNIEETECVSDLPDSGGNSVTINPSFELADEQEECNAVSVVKFLALMIAKWSYRHNITASALGALLKLIKLFLLALCNFSSFIKSVLSVFPSTVFTLKSFLRVRENDFVKYIVCPSCHSLYNYGDCFETIGEGDSLKFVLLLPFLTTHTYLVDKCVELGC